jgi:hypothetical protein
MKKLSAQLAALQVNTVQVVVTVTRDWYEEITGEDGDTNLFLIEGRDEGKMYEFNALDYDLSFFDYSDYLGDIVRCFKDEGAEFSAVGSVLSAHWAEPHDSYTHPHSGSVERVSVKFDMTYNDTAPQAHRAPHVTDVLSRDIRTKVG